MNLTGVKIMKKTIFCILTIVLVLVFQNCYMPDEKATNSADKVLTTLTGKGLDVNKDEKEKLIKIIKDYYLIMDDLEREETKKHNQGIKICYAPYYGEVIQKRDLKIKNVLNEETFKKYLKLSSEFDWKWKAVK